MKRSPSTIMLMLGILLLIVVPYGTGLSWDRWCDSACQTVLVEEDEDPTDKSDDHLNDHNWLTAATLTLTGDLRPLRRLTLLVTPHRATASQHDPAHPLRAPPA